MTNPTAFKACYSDWKLIRTRGVVQVVMEVPLAEADAAYKVLGGMPDAAREQWFGVAALKLGPNGKEAMPDPARTDNAKPQPNTAPAGAKPEIIFTCLKCEANYTVDVQTDECPVCSWKRKRDWVELKPSTASSIRCNEPTFRAYLNEVCGFDAQNQHQAAVVVRQLCQVDSRADLNTDPEAAMRWQALDDQYVAWKVRERA